jgi:hypothetical protein
MFKIHLKFLIIKHQIFMKNLLLLLLLLYKIYNNWKKYY